MVYPFLFAIYPILFLWSSNIRELSVFSSPIDLLLPLLVVEIATLSLLLAFWAILRNWRIAGLFVAFVILLFFSYGHVLEASAEHISSELTRNRNLIVIWILIFVAGFVSLFRFRNKLASITNPLNVMSVVLVAFTLPNILSYSPPSDIPLPNIETGRALSRDGASASSDQVPDIWYITSEGYSSSKILQRSLGYDNSSFVDYLTRIGFYIAEESNSNYHQTQNSLASSLNMQTVQMMLEQDDTGFISEHGLYPAIQNNLAMRIAREHGYQIVYLADRFPAGDEDLGDIYLGCGNTRLGIQREAFADALMMTTALNPFIVHFGLLNPSINDIRACDFFQLAKAQAIPSPKVVVVHLRVPGYPFVLSPIGKRLYSEDTSGAYQQAFMDQLSWTNEQLIQVFNTILSNPDYSPVIILQGDHGEPSTYPPGPQENGLQERFGIMNAYYLPNGGDQHMYPSITPVNTFRYVFDYYLDAELGLLEDRSYLVHHSLDGFIEVTDQLNQTSND